MAGVCAFPGCECATPCPGFEERLVDVDPGPRPPAAPDGPGYGGPGLTGGAIARAVDDAHRAYRARLARAVADLNDASTVQH